MANAAAKLSHGTRSIRHAQDSTQPHRGTDSAGERRLYENQQKQASSGGAQASHNAQVAPRPHHRRGKRIVNKEHSHKQRYQAESLEVQPEGPEHAVDGLGARGWPLHADGSRQQANEGASQLRRFSRFCLDEDAVEAADAAQGLLCRRNVHHAHVPAIGADERIGAEDACNVESHSPGPGEDKERAAHLEMMGRRERRGNIDRGRVGQEGGAGVGRTARACVLSGVILRAVPGGAALESRVSKGINPKQVNRRGFTADRPIAIRSTRGRLPRSAVPLLRGGDRRHSFDQRRRGADTRHGEDTRK
ncbi:MAG: hypothetical protein LC772_00515 [Chloroflexi bacterium]|nr:hypothetical protein [Chloroflexota bacterium]